MFRTLLNCPYCLNEIALEDARTEVPVPEESTWRKKVQWVYTVCPRCRRDFKVSGEKRTAIIVLVVVFSLLTLSFVVDSWLPLASVAAILLLQKKIMQLLIRAEHV